MPALPMMSKIMAIPEMPSLSHFMILSMPIFFRIPKKYKASITDINNAINDNPSIVNTDPYGEGWIVKIEPNNMDEINNLMDSEAYKQQIGV